MKIQAGTVQFQDLAGILFLIIKELKAIAQARFVLFIIVNSLFPSNLDTQQ